MGIGLTLLVALAGSTAPVDTGAPPPPARVAAQVGWSVALPATPLGPVRVVDQTPRGSLLIVPFPAAISAHDGSDGTLVWTRSDLPGGGLMAGDAVAVEGRPAFGWAGTLGNDPGRLIVIAAADGTALLDVPLGSPPVGAPLPLSDGGRAPQWFVPVAGGVVLVVAPTGQIEERIVAGRAEIAPPLAVVEGRVVAFVGPHRRLVALAAPGRLESPRLLAPTTVATGPRRLFAAQSRQLVSWSCRSLPRAGVRCRTDWRQRAGAEIGSAPLVLNAAVIAASRDSFLYAFRPDNGHLVWRVATPGRLTQTPLPWDELLAVAPIRARQIGFYRAADGAFAGTVESGEDEVFLTAPARSGSDLVVTVSVPQVEAPRELRSYRIERIQSPPGPRTADRNLSSSSR